MSDLVLFDREVLPGERAEIRIPIAHLPSHTLIDMPVMVLRGVEAGPRLMLSAGMHGDEINGIETLRRLLVRERIHPRKGSLVILPMVNIYGFLHNSRTLPDGKDLNRSFPGGKEGSLARQIAHILMQTVLPHVDYGVDFHTGGSRIKNYPQIRVNFEDETSRKLGQAFGAPILMHSALIDKSFRKEAAKQGKPILVYEGGESLRLDEVSIQEGIDGILRLMHHLDMIPQARAPRKSRLLPQSTWIRAKTPGIFSSRVNYGDTVRKNQIIAEINDPFGQSSTTVKSPRNGMVIGLNNMPVVNAGDALVHLGFEN